MKLKRIQSGVYETEDGKYRIERDGYEPVRTAEQEYKITVGSDARLTGGHRHDNVYYAPEEVCWVVLEGEQNLHMADTLKECRGWIERQYKKDQA